MVAFAFAAIACAQTTPPAHTNFSGRWRMVKDQSDFGSFNINVPDMVIRVIEQRDATLNLHTVETTHGKTSVSDIVYYTDGRESTNDRGGRSAVSRAFWDGNALMIRTDTTDSRNQAIEILEKWTLSPDRNTLTTTSDIGSAHLKMVCTRESVK